ncbi:MAG: hypothetical protein ABJK37_22830 [Paraglaciecola sp.]|uniref:hypothetical protein n=1 Tax=Paraglaciecola sp. TaxID=1920173 RepID=UPI003297C39E
MKKKLKAIHLLSFLIFPTVSQAGLIPSNITVTATVAFDDISSFILDTQQADSFRIGTQGSQVNDGLITGNNPVNGSLNESIVISSTLGAQNINVDFEYVRYFFDVNLSNTAADNTAEFVFDYGIFQQVSTAVSDPFTDDAFADSAIALFDNNNLEFVFSAISSDINPGPQTVAKSGTFSFLLNPGESLSFGGYYESNLYSFGDAAFSSLTSIELALTAVNMTINEVSEPSSFTLTFMLASLAMGYRRKATHKNIAE